MAEPHPPEKPRDIEELRKKACPIIGVCGCCSSLVQKYDAGTFLENARNFDIRRVPCGRDALLHGIGGGLAIGAVQFIRTRLAAVCGESRL